MKYIAGLMIGFGLSSLIWTAKEPGPNGWIFCLILGIAIAVGAEIAKSNGHDS